MTDKVIFTKEWYDEIMRGDDFVETTPQEMAYILYAAAVYSFSNEKTNIGEIFGKEYNGLNRTMSGYYGQIDRIINSGKAQSEKNQKYDNDAVERLAAQGYKQKEIALELGYDVTKYKSLSSNPGYIKGRKEWLASKEKGKNSTAVEKMEENCASFKENCQELAETSKIPFNF